MVLLSTSPGDGPVEEEVEKAEKEKGDESHHKKVGQEDIVSHIDGVAPQVCGAQVGKAAQDRSKKLQGN